MIKRASAAVAVSAFGLALGAGATFAADQPVPCGSPAVPAVYDWVVTQPGVSEVSHLEYQWAHQTAPERTTWQWQRTTTTTVYRWKLTTSHTEEKWSSTSPGDGWVRTDQSQQVVVQPAVTETRYEFRRWNQKDESFFGASRWDPDPAWNANDANGKAEGWERTTTPPQEFTVTPAVTETQYLWQLTTETVEYQESATKPGDLWEEDGVVSTSTKTEDAWSETQPEGEGWTKTGESQTTPATYEYRWSVTKPGDEWSQTDADPRKVVDVAGVQEQKEWQVVVPAVPAGEPCVVPPVEQPPVEQPPVEEGPVVAPVDDPAPARPEVKPTPKPTSKPASAVPQVDAVTAVSPTSLAHTGSDLTLLWTGLGLVVVGAGLSAGYRRVSRQG